MINFLENFYNNTPTPQLLATVWLVVLATIAFIGVSVCLIFAMGFFYYLLLLLGISAVVATIVALIVLEIIQ